MGSCPGGVANMAVAASRLGLRTAVAAAFGEDVYGDFCWETLANQEMVDLSASRRIPNWHSPFTVSLAYRGDRSMVTHEHPSPIPLQDMARDLPQARAAFVSLSNEDGVPSGRRSRRRTARSSSPMWDGTIVSAGLRPCWSSCGTVTRSCRTRSRRWRTRGRAARRWLWRRSPSTCRSRWSRTGRAGDRD